MKAKKLLAMLLCASMVLSNVSMAALGANETPGPMPIPETTQATTATHTYADSANSWAAASIERWSAAGVIKGDQNGNFNHTAKLSCAELAQILVNMFGLTAKAENTFADLKGDEWYADAVLKCVAAGILKGDGTNINAKRFVSRQETMVMFGRAVGVAPAAKPNLSKFSDAASVAPWAAGYLAPLAEMGIISGSGDGTINAVGEIDRASTASLLDKSIAFYITAPGEYKAQDGKRFVVVNASAKAGEVIISGTAAGVIVAAGTGNIKVLGRDLKADTFKVDGIAPVLLEGNSTVGELVANATGTIGIASGATVNTATANAAAAIANSGNIKALFANAPVAVDNKGTIGTANIKANGVVLGGTTPKELNVAQGTKNPTNSAGQEIKPVAPVTPPTNATTDDDYVAVPPKITTRGTPRAFKGDLFAEEGTNGKISNFDENRVLPCIAVSLEKGDYNYKNVRLVVETAEANKTKFQAIAIDENDVASNILKSGWGPADGFELKDDTTLVYMVGTEVGNYSATIKLVDVKNNNAVIARTSISVPVIDITDKQAIIGTQTYTTLVDAANAAKTGDVISLLQSGEQQQPVITINHGVVVNILRGITLTVPEDKTLTVNGNLSNDGTIVNNGTINLAGPSINNGNVINMNTFTNAGTINIAASGSQGIESYKNVFMNAEDFTSTGTINNAGNFATTLLGTSTLSGAASTMTVEAGGTNAVGFGGKMTVGTGAKVTIAPQGTMSVDESGTLCVGKTGTVEVTEGGKFENAGQIEIAGGELKSNGEIKLAGGKLVVGNVNAAIAPDPSPIPPEDETPVVPLLTNAETGTITNKGTIENYGPFENIGNIQNGDKLTNPLFAIIQNEGDIENHGTITNYGAIGNRGYSEEDATNEGYIVNYGIFDNRSAIANSGTLLNEEYVTAPGAQLTKGIMYNRENATLTNAGDIDIGSVKRCGALANGGTLLNVSTGSIYNYGFLVPEPVDENGGFVEDNLIRGTIVNEGEIALGENSILRHDIVNEGHEASEQIPKKEEGTIAVCDDANLGLAVDMGGKVRLNDDIRTDGIIVINNAVTLDGNNNCLTNNGIKGHATLQIGDGTAQLTDKVLIQDLIVCGPNTTADGWDNGEYAIKVFWASDVTLDSVWMIYANAGLQVNSSKVTLKNDTCLASNEFGGIEVANGADNHGPGELNIATGATIMQIGKYKDKPTIWKDTAAAGTITDNADILNTPVNDGNKVYYFVKNTTPEVLVEVSHTFKDIQPSYNVNLAASWPNKREYAWGVQFTSNGNDYQVSTEHFKLENSTPETKTLQQMQTTLWRKNAQGSYSAVQGANVTLTVEGNTLTWKFKLQDDMNGVFTGEKSFTVDPTTHTTPPVTPEP